MVKPNVKKRGEVQFIVWCRNQEKKVYVHVHQDFGDIACAKCCCPAATQFQLLNNIELGLSDVPDDKPAPRSYKNGISLERTLHKKLCFLRT